MEQNKAHEIARDIVIAMITSDKPIVTGATGQGNYVASVCDAYKMVFDTVMKADVKDET